MCLCINIKMKLCLDLVELKFLRLELISGKHIFLSWMWRVLSFVACAFPLAISHFLSQRLPSVFIGLENSNHDLFHCLSVQQTTNSLEDFRKASSEWRGIPQHKDFAFSSWELLKYSQILNCNVHIAFKKINNNDLVCL